ncbi:MDR family MFS transporter [Kibdelosporangium phytohabitans]|uniref:Disulfide bond formation protein DsbA n=1 Tax=Kibdelosporangium phytohabitans TaxID=860235 RepID=A0A0N9HVF4_9PSEU|nr:MDR family MFS transporter [Kibdelosporangium phytohabitans]ALG06169.1 disulfide bond formation protein DsbA [Kibdelosporangium phytohabitans]MBE1465736.1 EmrB/QacA subfamily drug resistance transporter [Kibdelosporangium phytohabitans]
MTQVARTAVGLRSERGPILGSIMLATALVALDSTIIATAVPSVVADLGGFSQFPWLFSIYLLTQAVTTPLYGKFADLFGRKPVLLFGIGVFLLGSVLCGAAWSMPVLIAARAIQGIGAGAVQPISMTMLGDLYTLEERARVQGYATSVWAASSLIGPALGGVFAEYVSWRWIFFINLPIGALAVFVLMRKFNEKITRSKHKIDYLGSALLTIGLSLVLLGLLEGGVAWAWNSVPSVLIFAVGVAALVAFGFVERKAAEPVLPLWVFQNRTIVGGNMMSLIVGALMMGLSSYLPTFAEGVLGTGALVAGFTLAAMTIGWPIAATLSGHAYMRIGLRNTAMVGAVFAITGSVLTTLLSPATAVWMAGAVAFVVGVGLGLASSPSTIAVQVSVGWERRGVATGTNMFARSLGSAVGVAVFGAIANATLADRFANPPADVAGKLPDSLDATSLVLGAHDDSPVSAFVRGALFDATHNVFTAMVVIAVLSVVALMLMPSRTAAERP